MQPRNSFQIMLLIILAYFNIAEGVLFKLIFCIFTLSNSIFIIIIYFSHSELKTFDIINLKSKFCARAKMQYFRCTYLSLQIFICHLLSQQIFNKTLIISFITTQHIDISSAKILIVDVV